MKRCMWFLTGFMWAIYFVNDDSLFYALLMTALTVIIELCTEE